MLLKSLNQQGAEATKEIGKYTKKAAASGAKVAKVAKAELQKNASKTAKK